MIWYEFYAIQSFEHQGRRIAVGWIADNYEEHVEAETALTEQHGGCLGELRVKRRQADSKAC